VNASPEPEPDASVTEDVPLGASCATHDSDASFVCTRCGNFGCGECIFSAIEGREVCVGCASKGLGKPIPWERRKEVGTIKAFWETSKLCLKSPALFFRTPTTHENVFAAVAHGTIAVTIGLFLSYVVAGLLMMAAGGTIAVVGDQSLGPMGAIFGTYGCVTLGLSPFIALMAGPMNALMGQVFAAACAHGVLVLAKKSKGGFEETLRVCSYANAPYLFTFIPLLGSFTWFWVVGIEVIGLRETHRCGTDWAALAAVGYRVAFTVMIVLGYAVMVLGMFALVPPR